MPYGLGAVRDALTKLRQARLDGRPLMVASLSDDIQAQGLADAAGAALQASSTVALSEVSFLSRDLVQEACYAGGMQAVGRFHRDWTITHDMNGRSGDLLRVFEEYKWSLAQIERRLKSLL